MKIEPLNLADFDLVELNSAFGLPLTPHCKKHGAMNKITADGIWRCITITGFAPIKQDGSKQKGNVNSLAEVHRENICRAGCYQITNP